MKSVTNWVVLDFSDFETGGLFIPDGVALLCLLVFVRLCDSVIFILMFGRYVRTST